MTWEGRLTFEVSSADPDSASPVWVDLTARIRDVVSPIQLTIGRATELDQTEPAQLTVVLDNADGALTFGNTTSPYAAWWGPGRRCRLRERVTSAVTQDRFVGFIQMPTETITTDGVENRVTISAIDRLGRLDNGDAFVSTLAAHIVGTNRGSLMGYWPLNDTRLPFAPLVSGDPLNAFVQQSGEPTITAQPSVTLAAVAGPPGDDVNGAIMSPGVAGASSAIARGGEVFLGAALNGGLGISLAAGQVATAVVWVNADLTFDEQFSVLDVVTSDGDMLLDRTTSGGGGDWRVHKPPTGSLVGSADSGSAVPSSKWCIAALRFGFTPNVLDMWIDDEAHSASMTGTVLSLPLTNLYTFAYGAVAHLQLYVGSPSDFTHADFLAQWVVGNYALERQTTGARITSIATYAGVPTSELTQVDTGTAVMSRASLAGKNPLTAMREAEATERGLLWVDGSGNTVFYDRPRLYSQ